MPSDATTKRLTTLEMTMEGLAGLPAQVAAVDARVGSLELQLFQFREEVRGEFSAVRQEIASGDAALREEIKLGVKSTKSEMRLLHEDLVEKIKLLNER